MAESVDAADSKSADRKVMRVRVSLPAPDETAVGAVEAAFCVPPSSPRRINEIVLAKRAITADTALRLGKFFGMEAQFWMNLQSHYDLEVAKDAIAGKLDREVEVLKAA